MEQTIYEILMAPMEVMFPTEIINSAIYGFIINNFVFVITMYVGIVSFYIFVIAFARIVKKGVSKWF